MIIDIHSLVEEPDFTVFNNNCCSSTIDSIWECFFDINTVYEFDDDLYVMMFYISEL